MLKDLKRGEIGEQKIIDLLNRHNINIYKSKLKSYDLDIFITKTYGLNCPIYDVSITGEVKNDIMAKTTGNIAIEFFNCKSNKPSGVTATPANIWFHVLDDEIWIIAVKKLKAFINNTKGRIITGVGDGNADIMLYPKDVLTEANNWYRIDNLTCTELKDRLEFVFDEC